MGLTSSTFHLGKPRRAWRAFSQWRTSWLSREGVFAMITYAPALLFGWCVWRGESGFVMTAVALALALSSLLTISCTAMIYTSLKPIPAWNHSLVYPVYLTFALLTGGLWFACCAGLVPLDALPGSMAMALLLAFFKQSYWRAIDRIEMPSRESATALEGIGKVTVFERPHTEANYLTREMGFVLARKHSRKLRAIALLLFAGVPLLALMFAWLLPVAAVFALWIAALSALAGAFVERWLFFAEAKHMVMLYY
ncbi:MAG TPA: DmsC/YnfH family molybdoenzyme membrane anchor subunit [Xanthomonadaceae bacterium]|nr:DmsC/YnfH family molybdoenzyme membrane anchor subunit [Xanthomonadaceae bacterium]